MPSARSRQPRVVFHKIQVQASGFIKGSLIEAFIEESARVAEHLGFDDEDVGDGGGRYYLHGVGLGAWTPGQARDDKVAEVAAMTVVTGGAGVTEMGAWP